MAATNYTPIQLYHSTTASAVPLNTNLVNGELAINIADGKLYYKDSGGTVQVIASKATGTIGGSTTQVQYNSSGALAGSANFTFNGTTATINALNLTNALGAAYGGTAQSTYTQGDLLYASAANTLSKLAIGSNNQVLTSSGTDPVWVSGLNITTLTATQDVTFSATSQNIALGTSQTSGLFTIGGASQTGAIVVGQSTKTQSLSIANGAVESGLTKTINIGTNGDAGSTTNINIGSGSGTITTNFSGTVNVVTANIVGAVTMSATTQNINLGTSQTTGTFTVGGAAQTGTQTFGQSTKTHSLDVSSGATESGETKTITLGANGVSGSTTSITIGSPFGSNTRIWGGFDAAAVTQNITIGTSQTSGTFTVGGTAQTGAISIDRSTKTHTLDIATGATESGLTKTINLGTAGVSGSTTAITIGSANGTTTTLNGTVTAATFNSTTIDTTNLEVTNIKAKDGTAALSIADSTGAVTVSSAFAANGGVTIGDASGDALTINSSAVSTPNGLNFDSNTFVIDATNNRVGIGTSSPSAKVHIAGVEAADYATALTTNSLLSNAAPSSFLYVQNDNDLDGTFCGIAFNTTRTGGGGNTAYIANIASSSNNAGILAFGTRSGTNALAERLRIDSSGNVGIGTNAPTNLLSVAGNANITGNTTLGDASTDTVQVNGYMAVGGALNSGIAVRIGSSALGGATQRGAYADVTFTSASTTRGAAFESNPSTAVASFTVTDVMGFSAQNVATLGAGSTITNQHGVYVNDQTRGTNNFGVTSLVSSGTNKWNIYASGTANNYFGGSVGMGTTPSAWGTGAGDYIMPIEWKNGCAISTYQNADNPVLSLTANATHDGTNWIYKTTVSKTAQWLYLDGQNGNIALLNAVGGTVGNTISWLERFKVSASEAVFNDPGNDYDFRVESDTNTHALFVEGTNSNVKIGGSAERATTVGTNHLDIFNGTAPVGTLTNGISIYSSSGEAYVMDAAGNATLFSPHDSETNEWIFKSKHTPTGKVLKIDVEKLLRFVNNHFGLDAIQEFIEE